MTERAPASSVTATLMDSGGLADASMVDPLVGAQAAAEDAHLLGSLSPSSHEVVPSGVLFHDEGDAEAIVANEELQRFLSDQWNKANPYYEGTRCDEVTQYQGAWLSFGKLVGHEVRVYQKPVTVFDWWTRETKQQWVVCWYVIELREHFWGIYKRRHYGPIPCKGPTPWVYSHYDPLRSTIKGVKGPEECEEESGGLIDSPYFLASHWKLTQGISPEIASLDLPWTIFGVTSVDYARKVGRGDSPEYDPWDPKQPDMYRPPSSPWEKALEAKFPGIR